MSLTKTIALSAGLLFGSGAASAGVLYFDTPINYQILAISHNGEWASGVVVADDGSVTSDFRWNLTTGKIELINATGVCTGVSDDGTIVTSNYISKNGNSYEAPLLWKDGKFTELEMPSGMAASWAAAISPDGRYVTGGGATADGAYNSYIWTDGKLTHLLENTKTSMSYCISPNGQYVGGWMYGSSNGNRCAGYWTADDKQFHMLEPDQKGQAWMTARKFSYDNNRILYWGGYQSDPAHPELGKGIRALYDFTTGERTIIYPTEENPFNFDLFDISDNGSVVGYQQHWDGAEQAVIYRNGETIYLEDYLVSNGADFSKFDIYPYNESHLLARCVAVSGDEKTFGIVYYDSSFEMHSMIVSLDRDVTMTAPINVETSQVYGLKVVSLVWDEPLGDIQSLQGYNVYRDGSKVNSDLISSCFYYDKVATNGSYDYTVTAVYADGESKLSKTSTVTVSDNAIQAPREVTARQKGYNTAYLNWAAPASNLVPCTYVSDNSEVEGFGGGSYSFESAVRFPADLLNLYDDYSLTAVSFYPGSAQGSWLINIYTYNNGKLTLLGSTKVNQELQYGIENTVKLSKAIKLAKDHDYLIGIQTNVTNSSYNVQGCFSGQLKVGYTDLIRMIGEDDFYSLNTASNGATYDMTWGTSAFIAPSSASSSIDDVDHYNVYFDNHKAGETVELRYQDATLSEGAHTASVEAVYADGRISPIVMQNFSLTPNVAALPAIKPQLNVQTEDGKIALDAAWEAPLDNDKITMGYCSDKTGKSAPSTANGVDEFLARSDFFTTGDGFLAGYAGYNIIGVSLYPLSEGSFDSYIYINGAAEYGQTLPELTVGEWNTILFDEPVEVVRGKNYALIMRMYNLAQDVSPLGVDNKSKYASYTNLYQLASDETWYSIESDLGVTGNWMMRLVLSDPEGQPFVINGYGVYLDDNLVSQTSDTHFAHDLSNETTANHTLRVDANYALTDAPVQGHPVNFTITPTGITEILPASVPLKRYDLLGRPLAPNRATDAPRANGIFILNGQKVRH